MHDYSALSDADAVRAVLRGQRDVFAVLVRRHLPAVMALAVSTTSSHADAEEISQEVLLRAFKHLGTLRDGSRFGCWVSMITKNVARRTLAQRRKRVELARALSQTERAVAPDVEGRDTRRFVCRQIADLDEPHRDVLMLYYFAGRSLPEAALTLGITEAAAKKRLQRARAALGDRIFMVVGQELRDAGTTDRERRVRCLMGVVALAFPAQPTPSAPVRHAPPATASPQIGGVRGGPPRFREPVGAMAVAARKAAVPLSVALAMVLCVAGLVRGHAIPQQTLPGNSGDARLETVTWLAGSSPSESPPSISTQAQGSGRNPSFSSSSAVGSFGGGGGRYRTVRSASRTETDTVPVAALDLPRAELAARAAGPVPKPRISPAPTLGYAARGRRPASARVGANAHGRGYRANRAYGRDHADYGRTSGRSPDGRRGYGQEYRGSAAGPRGYGAGRFGAGYAGDNIHFSSIVQLFHTIDDRLVGETPAIIGISGFTGPDHVPAKPDWARP